MKKILIQTLFLLSLFTAPAFAQESLETKVSELNQRSLSSYRSGDLDSAMTAINTAIELINGQELPASLLAQTFNNAGFIASGLDNFEQSAISLEKALEIYLQEGEKDKALIVSSNLLPTYSRLGLHNKLPNQRKFIEANLDNVVDSIIRLEVTKKLAESYLLTNSQDTNLKAISLLEQLEDTTSLLLKGKAQGNLGLIEEANQSFEQAIAAASSLRSQRAVLLEKVKLNIKDKQVTTTLVDQFSLLQENSNYGQNQELELQELLAENDYPINVAKLNQIARSRDSYLKSKAFYILSFSSSSIDSKDTLETALAANPNLYYQYKIKAKLGDLYAAEKDSQSAIAFYSQAIDQIKEIKGDLLTSPDFQFEFIERVQPVHEKLVQLLVVDQKQPSQADLQLAINTVESLQLLELENYFRAACIEANQTNIETTVSNTAIVYPVFLDNNLISLIGMPDGKLDHKVIDLSKTEAAKVARRFRLSLNQNIPISESRRFSQEIYSWLIEPWNELWQSEGIDNLVFIPTETIRNLPLAALQDSEGHYLIEKYSTAYAPGMAMINPSKDYQRRRVLVGALSQQHQGFEEIPGVLTEISKIQSIARTKSLVNAEFTESALDQIITNDRGNLLHLATHGQFGTTPEDTFLLAWGDKIFPDDLYQLIGSRNENPHNSPIELLVLSACETAKGDTNNLGLAGMAIRSGAKSTIASLWQINDESTSTLMQDFYTQFSGSNSSKAQILQQVQLKLLNSSEYSHPYYWAAFQLLGNWL